MIFGLEHHGPCYIVGKGPSLMNLKASDFGEGIIIALYESIIPIEKMNLPNKIYSFQKDKADTRPKRATLIVHEHESKDDLSDYPDRIVFDAEKLGLNWSTPSAPCVVKMATLMGCNPIYMLCFDGLNGDNRTCVATEEGFELKDFPNNFLYKAIAEQAREINPEIIFI